MATKLDTQTGFLASLPSILGAYFMVKMVGPLPALILWVFCLIMAHFFGKDAIIPSFIIVLGGLVAMIAYKTSTLPI
tara:strand:+ start:45 stop:275 length:231 start_codon:yes stop_codon:yes gene_type:complete